MYARMYVCMCVYVCMYVIIIIIIVIKHLYSAVNPDYHFRGRCYKI